MVNYNNNDDDDKGKINATARHPLSNGRLALLNPDLPFWVTLPRFYTGQDLLWSGISLWPLWVTCPTLCPPGFFLQILLTGRS